MLASAVAWVAVQGNEYLIFIHEPSSMIRKYPRKNCKHCNGTGKVKSDIAPTFHSASPPPGCYMPIFPSYIDCKCVHRNKPKKSD